MADQRIFFEQGSPETGDSGERGDSTEGVASIKPLANSERAGQEVFNRPSENFRKRTEALRVAGEEAKYLLDSDMRWIISAGDAAGLSGGPATMPGISAWDPVGGTFTTSAPIVVQPINTPSSDLQETKTYAFTDGLSQTASIAFTPLSYAEPTASGEQKRAYNGANLIKIVWEAVPEASLASATIPNYCNTAISGDPEHILTISIRDDNTTQMSNIVAALAIIETVAGELQPMGLGYVISGTAATSLLISEIPVLERGYRMKNTFEREVHYIPVASFSDFFSIPNALTDGDTLSIWCADYVTDPVTALTPQMTGRRESVPSNNTSTYPGTTEVAAVRMFITSSAVDVYKIPLAIPLCKRIGDDLYWMDGTVVTGTQALLPVYFGENGVTVDRTAAGPDILAADSNVTGHWLFNDRLSVGTVRSSTTEYSVLITSAVSTLAGLKVDTTDADYGMQIAASGAGTTAGLELETIGASFGVFVTVDTTAAAGIHVAATGATDGIKIEASGAFAGLHALTTTSTYGAFINNTGGTAGLKVDTTDADYGMQIAASGGTTGLKVDITTSATFMPEVNGLDTTIQLVAGSSTINSYGMQLEHDVRNDADVTGELIGASIVLYNRGPYPFITPVLPAEPSVSYGLKVDVQHSLAAGGQASGFAGVYVNAAGVTSGIQVVTADVIMGLSVETTATEYGLVVKAADAEQIIWARAAIGTTEAQSTFEGSVVAGGPVSGGAVIVDPPTGSVSLDINGAFRTLRTDVLVGDLLQTDSEIDVRNTSFVTIYGATALTNKLVWKFLNGVDGQWLVITNRTDPYRRVDVTPNGGNIIMSTGSAKELKTNEAFLFVYDAVRLKWQQIDNI